MLFGRTLTVLAALASTIIPLARPAAAATASPDMRGSYFGSFTSSAGNPLASDLNIGLQVNRTVSGTFSMGAVLQEVSFSGKLKPNGTFAFRGRQGQAGTRVNYTLTGTFDPGGNGRLAVLQGRYTVSGAWREQGTFILTGATHF